MRELDELQALRDLDDVWERLRRMVSASPEQAPTPDEFRALLGEAQVLFGRTTHLIDKPIWTAWNRQVHAFSQVLAQPDLHMARVDRFWNQSWGGGSAAIHQAVGRQEERIARLKERGIDVESVARWRHLITALERLRGGVGWLLRRPRFLTPLVSRVENWPVYRAVSVVSTVGGLIGLVILLLTAVGLLAGYLAR